MFQKTMHSLSSRVAALIFGGTTMSIIAIALSVLWVFERSLDSQLDNHLTAYNDIMVSAIKVKNGEAVVDAGNALLQAIPRHWQIDLPNGEIITSPLLKTPFPVHSFPYNIRFLHIDGDTKIIAYQQYIDFPSEQKLRLTFGLEEKVAEHYKTQIKESFSRYVYGTLSGIALFLLVVGWIIIASVIRPIRAATYALSAVKDGNETIIKGSFPTEIADLADQVNSLLGYADAVMKRHRTFSSNVAHALKTPLTVIRNETDSNVIKERVDAMLQVIDRNLARIQTSGGSNVLSSNTLVKPILERIIDGFGKVYQKQIDNECDDHLSFRVDEADLYEIFGNLIENACKFAESDIRIHAYDNIIIIEDDGPGIPEPAYDIVLGRGIRLDQTKSGSGIGMAITCDVIELYGGTLELGKSELGGLKVIISWNISST